MSPLDLFLILARPKSRGPQIGESRPFCLEEVIGENFRFHLKAVAGLPN
jgi:hypothetical protein